MAYEGNRPARMGQEPHRQRRDEALVRDPFGSAVEPMREVALRGRPVPVAGELEEDASLGESPIGGDALPRHPGTPRPGPALLDAQRWPRSGAAIEMRRVLAWARP